jgi:hypothetical protein
MNEATSPLQSGNVAPQNSTNLYPYLRKMFFAVCIVLFLFIILYLIYSNGKSIYANGI